MFDSCQSPVLRSLALGHRAVERLRRCAGSVRQTKDGREKFYERVWREAADQLGASFTILDRKIQQISLGCRTTNVWCNYTELDGPVTLRLAGNKGLVNRLLREARLPTPQASEFSLNKLSQARRFLKRLQRPCVIKPARNTGAGQGVTTCITRSAQLVRAAIVAGGYCPDLLIEEQVPGDNYRLLFLDGALLDAVHRRPPSVEGDGKSTIAHLVRQANARRLAGGADISQVLLACDDDMRRTLAARGLSPSSVPAPGERVYVKTVINDNSAADNVPVPDLICPAIVEDARRAVAVIGGRLVGVDIITTDPSRPLRSTGGVILELNTTPGFYYHYARPAGICPVALHVLATIFGVCPAGSSENRVREPYLPPVEVSCP